MASTSANVLRVVSYSSTVAVREGFDVIVRSPAALAQAMSYRGYSVRSLAVAVGANRSTIGHLRSGHRRSCEPVLAARIAAALQMPIDFLFVPRPSSSCLPRYVA